MASDKIVVRGAREHNLKSIDVELPRDKLVVITGLSGSGKSSLAFDTIYAEGQRRYVESLSAYARQFLGLMEKPDVDQIEGLSPAIAIEQRSAGRNPRSTVGTATELYDYLRLLFARIGIPHCPKCGRRISQQTIGQMCDEVMRLPDDTRIQVLAPVVRGRKGEYRDLLRQIQREGYVRVRVDGETRSLEDPIDLDKNKRHDIQVVVDRLVIRPGIRGRLVDSLETAVALGEGIVTVDLVGEREIVFSERFACVECGISFEEIEPRLFSFNSPYGACPKCDGLGSRMEIDPELVVPDHDLSLNEGTVAPWGTPKRNWLHQQVRTLASHYGIDRNARFRDLPEQAQRVLLWGTGKERLTFQYRSKSGRARGEYVAKFEGVIPNLERRYRETESGRIREWIERFMAVRSCPECGGTRLKPEALAVKIDGRHIAEVSGFSIGVARRFFDALDLSEREQTIARQILKEIRERLGFLSNVGVEYLTLDRTTGTLSGGEAQRIRLATQIGSQLVGVLYILDEPSIGLHQRDNRRLLDTLLRLRDLGNTVLVVEHDRDTIRAADWIVDLGPGAGRHGGEVVAAGSPAAVAQDGSLTGDYLAGRRRIEIPSLRRPGLGAMLEVVGAEGNNLKSIHVHIPLGTFTCITGVSGSGKSTLVNETLYRALAQRFYRAKDAPLAYGELRGVQLLDKVIDIDQSPIGRTPRSNPATYTGTFTPIRGLFAQVPEAKIRGYRPGRFSFNVKGGRCEACEGAGIVKIEMHFLPDVYVPCEVCTGKRYNRETLEIRYRGKSIADVLDMTVNEALEFLENIPSVRRKLQTLSDVGLGYIHLGQQATTLSGGEAQRVKLASELSKVSTGRTLYILDEPTTGLHFEDIKLLLSVLGRLVDRGNTVVVIEHNMDVIKTADWIVDLGPEGGDAGGSVIAEGPPEAVAEVEASHTGRYLREIL